MNVKPAIGYHLIVFLLCLNACNQDEQQTPLLSLKTDTGIDFNNVLIYTDSINPYTYRNFYNGSGIAIGDLDNDGLDDVFFTGNQVDNVVYKNLGDFKFADVTDGSGLASEESWSTGVSMVDINGDHLLDIYVCKAGPPGGSNRKNQLFINQGDFIFKDEASLYGLDVIGLSIQASFFDYDLDGDLDCYLLNNSLKSVGGYDLKTGQRNLPSENGNKFFENVNGKFVDRTIEKGIYSSDIGFGLGVMVVDVNNDSYPDIYVGNDFFEKDYLYINQNGKGFKEEGEEYFSSFPLGSMGVDAADLNNDLHADIFVAEMLPATLERQKTKAIFDTWEKYQNTAKQGYHYQMPRNMLYLNQYPNDFVELGRMYDCYATEWSWAPLIFDIDNDGYKDLFISNGVGRDLLDRDYLAYMADNTKVAKLIREDKKALSKLIDLMPESKVQNAIFRNKAMHEFENVSNLWSNMPVSVSNASAYSDLDNDGDLDLIVANINDNAFVLENTLSANNWIGFNLNSDGLNTKAIGAKIIAYANDQKFMVQNIPQRGFQSSVSTNLNLGLGDLTKIDSVIIYWPEGRITKMLDLKINQYNTIRGAETNKKMIATKSTSIKEQLLVEMIDTVKVMKSTTIPNDFNKDPLTIHMMAQAGPSFAVAQLDSDSDFELVLGGGKDIASSIYGLELSKQSTAFLEKKKYGEVVGTYVFDSDSDGDMDIYLAQGSRLFSQYSSELDDILLINHGDGSFEESSTGLAFPKPTITSSVSFGDVDKNGFIDIFVTEAIAKNIYGLSGNGYLFLNQGNNKYELVNSELLDEIGMMRTSALADLDGDGSLEIMTAGEWMGIEIFRYLNGKVVNVSDEFNLSTTNGIWNVIELVDLDKDGDLDIIAGNAGVNGAYKKDMTLAIFDFDRNGKPEQIVSREVKGKYYPIHDLDELSKQVPGVRKKYSDYKSYATSSMNQVFGDNDSNDLGLDLLKSSVFINEKGSFIQQGLPLEIQYSSVHAISTMDVNFDGAVDIILGGNHYNYKPQFGRDDASSGWIVLGQIHDGHYEFGNVINLGIEGEIRTIESLSDSTAMIGILDKDIYTYKIKMNNE